MSLTRKSPALVRIRYNKTLLLTSITGTTWHTAGLVWDLARTDVETEIVQRTVRLLKSLEDETGVGTGWINNGGLFIAKSPVWFNEASLFYAKFVLFKVFFRSLCHNFTQTYVLCKVFFRLKRLLFTINQ